MENANPKKMVLGHTRAKSPLIAQPASSGKPQDAAVVSPPKMRLPTPPSHADGVDFSTEISTGLARLSSKEQKRVAILSTPTQTTIYLNQTLQPAHDRCRARNKEAFGQLHYGYLLHVGISRIRSLTTEDRLALLERHTHPKSKGKMTPLKLTKSCFLDFQQLWIQVREELWVAGSTQEFGMGELIMMVDEITASTPMKTLREEYVRAILRRS
ncbi:MAG: hypothetical protein H6827_09835 [Planctomycetes bacterium]|nr:hypothetical protein [Planctomycetota bacterium]